MADATVRPASVSGRHARWPDHRRTEGLRRDTIPPCLCCGDIFCLPA